MAPVAIHVPRSPASGAAFTRLRGAAALVLARALVCAAVLVLAAAPAAIAAEGGPSLNIPVPATAKVGASAAPTTTAAAATPLPPATSTGAAGGAAATPPATTTTAAPLGAAPAHPVTSGATPRSSGTSGTAIALAAIAAVLVLLCAAWVVVRTRGVEPHWTLSLRHSMAEASHRASATWAELGDWVRLGR